MTIRELKPSQRVEGRWLAVLDDGSILRIGGDEVVAFSLYTGKELTEEEALALQAAARSRAIKSKALDLLSRKPQSRRELERRLGEWGAEEETCAALCDRLEELGYLDDGRYAEQVVRHYAAKGYGTRKLRDELYRRGVPRDLWDEALAQAEDPAEQLDAFVAKKLAGTAGDRRDLQRVSAALARRGYGWSEINDALRRYDDRLILED